MVQRLSGQTSMFGVFFVSKSLLRIERQKKLNEITILTQRPQRHFRILIYRMWSIAGSSWENPSQPLERKSLFSFMSQLICNTYYIVSIPPGWLWNLVSQHTYKVIAVSGIEQYYHVCSTCHYNTFIFILKICEVSHLYIHLILRLKFFRSSSGGHVTVTSASSKILHSLSGLSHPIPRLILSAVKGHLEGYSDGGLRTALLLLRCILIGEKE